MVKKYFSFTFLILTFVSFGYSQAVKKTNTAAEQNALVTEFEVNGLKVLVKNRPSAQTVVGGLFIRGGARNITAKNAGIENLMLNSAVEAGKNFPRQTVRREISRAGSGISAASNNDYSAVSLVTTRQNFDKLWEIFADVTMNPAFANEDVDRIRGQILTGLREREINPEGALEASLDRVVYAGHPYANEVSGTSETIKNLTAADLRAYHQKVMQTSQLLLVFVGDLNPDELKTKIANSFGKLPRGNYKDQAYPALDFSKPTVDVVSRNLPTNYIQGVFDAPSLSNPDYYPMRVAISILQYLVYQEVRIKRQLSYAPGAEIDNYSVNTANISVTANDANQAIYIMLEMVKLLRTQPLENKDVETFTGTFLITYYLGQETSTAQAGELAKYELIGGGWRNASLFLDKINEVKAADVQRVSNKYMKNIRFVVVGNPAAVNKEVFLKSGVN
ncbi:MAG TPA: pitrilysin family protein [Pyrinomonadaceae bacterium]|nr:pitrilysin family protein [Pyrinomonadaceae bacterium]